VSRGLVAQDITVDVAARRILDRVALHVEPGRMVSVSGPSGSGKTTLLSVAGGLVEPTSGTVRFAGEPVWSGDGDPRPDVAFILQVYGLVPILTARENVAIALRSRGVAPAEADQRADLALAALRVEELADRLVEELSGGQMQRVAGARGLVVDAALLLADEPTSELDEVNREHVLAELRRAAEGGAAVVVATHDPAVVEACDADLHLVDGAVASTTLGAPVGG
jgi:putative ABC transport system ATP-binding protein